LNYNAGERRAAWENGNGVQSCPWVGLTRELGWDGSWVKYTLHWVGSSRISYLVGRRKQTIGQLWNGLLRISKMILLHGQNRLLVSSVDPDGSAVLFRSAETTWIVRSCGQSDTRLPGGMLCSFDFTLSADGRGPWTRVGYRRSIFADPIQSNP